MFRNNKNKNIYTLNIIKKEDKNEIFLILFPFNNTQQHSTTQNYNIKYIIYSSQFHSKPKYKKITKKNIKIFNFYSLSIQKHRVHFFIIII